eukprot:GHUV01015784.1.p1 GENE.GHUV01015784.1~~GHUV01015784.1.p1  ORF type:complete len:434 (+),score=93.64 GHUV01015784.1:211-1512(+)
MEMQLDAVVHRLLAGDVDITNVSLEGKRVLYRVDLNLPLTHDNKLADDTRLKAILPTLQLLLNKGSRVVLCSHLGRPEPEKHTWQEMRQKYSLAPVAEALQQLLGPGVFRGLAPDCVGKLAEAEVQLLEPGQACLLENLRFHSGESRDDPSFAQQLAALGDVYVNDAFGVSHRSQASVVGVLPHMKACYPGLLMRAELNYLHRTCNQPARPFGVIVGGAKVKDKIKVIESLLHKTDVLLIGGRMAFTFLAAEGVAVGRTQIEEEWLQPCRQMRQLALERGVQLLLPQDVVVARSLDDDHGCCTVPLTQDCCSSTAPCVPEGCFGLDIGPKTAAAFIAAMKSCRTLFWNGPMGRFEVPGFAQGTAAIAAAMGDATENGVTTVIGGGDSVAAVNALQPRPRISFISTGGGASLELIRGDLLPGLRSLAEAIQQQQ